MAVVTITINPINDAPVGMPDAYTVVEGGTLDMFSAVSVLLNDSDAENNFMTVIIEDAPVNASSFSLNPDGTFTYIHNDSDTFSDSFTYIINDGQSVHNLSEEVTVFITVIPTNDPPTSNPDSYRVNEGGTLAVPLDSIKGVLFNDVDGENNTLTAVLVSGPANATSFSLNRDDGSFSYEHNGSEASADSFTYKTNDGLVDGNTTTVTITINPVNDAPVSVVDAYTVNEAGTLTVSLRSDGVLANDTDAEDNALTAVLVTGPLRDSFFDFNVDGTFTYEHNGSETTTDSFSYQAKDSHNVLGNIMTVTITINSVNDPPHSKVDIEGYTVFEGGGFAVPIGGVLIAAEAEDVDSAVLTAVLVQGPQHAIPDSFFLNADGSMNYFHDGSEPGAYGFEDSFTFRVSDGIALGNLSTVTIKITAVNDAPDSVEDAYSVNEGGTLTKSSALGVLANDTDAEDNLLTAELVVGTPELVVGPFNASSFTLNTNGSFSYVHNGSETTTDSFSYRAKDSIYGDVAVVTITINPVNDAPVGVPDAYTVVEGGTLGIFSAVSVLLNDSDAENNFMTVIIEDAPVNASSFSLNPDGTFTYIHNDSDTFSDSFSYRIKDGQSVNNLSEEVTVFITVIPTNDPPTSKPDSYSVNEGGTLAAPLGTVKGVLFNDVDGENNTLTAVLVSGPANATSFSLNRDDGSFNYVHNGSEISVDSFTYKTNDGLVDGNTTTVTITINPVNDAPVSVVDAYTVNEAGTLTVSLRSDGVLANDTDAEDNALTAVLVTGPLRDSFFDFNVDGTFTYEHNGSETTTDSFSYQAKDSHNVLGNIMTVTITINSVNDPPHSKVDIEGYTVFEGGGFAVPIGGVLIAAEAEDVDSAVLTAVLVQGPQHAIPDSFFLNADGSMGYFHDGSEPGAYGFEDSFTFRVSDGIALGNLSTVTIKITAVNDAPDSVEDAYSVNEGGTLTKSSALGVLANDTDAEDNLLTAELVVGTPELVVGPFNASSFTLNTNGSFSYVHNGSETTTDSFSYRAKDSIYGDVAVVTITINPVNDAPVGVPDAYTVVEGGTLGIFSAVSVLLNDSDAENNFMTVIIEDAPVNASSFSLNPDGTFTYIHNDSDTFSDSFSYRIKDGQSVNNLSEEVTVFITVIPTNDPPTSKPDSYSVNEGGTLAAPLGTVKGVLFNDVDGENNTLTAVLVSGPANATSFSLNRDDGSFNYVHNGSEISVDSFTYKTNDGLVDGNTTTVTITINPVNDAPVSVVDAYTVNEAGTLTVSLRSDGVLANDTDAEDNALTAVLVTGPLRDSFFDFNVDGTFTYEHNGSETTTDSFSYQAKDSHNVLGNIMTVTITINSVNDPPHSKVDIEGYTVFEGGGFAVPIGGVLIAAEAEDVDSAVLTAVLVQGPQHAIPDSFFLNADGSMGYFHDGSEPGAYGFEDSFTFRVSDGIALGNLSTVTIKITAVNDAPDSVEDAYSVNEGGTLTKSSALGVLANDTDAEDNLLTAELVVGTPELVVGPFNASSFTLNTNGSFSYVHNGSETTTDSFSYRAKDSIYGDVAVVTITINPINDAPKTVNDTYTINEGDTLFAVPGIFANDSDAENNVLTPIIVTNPANAASFTLNTDGSFTYIHNGSETTSDSFSYKVQDSAGALSNTSIVSFTINAINDLPVANADSYTALQGHDISINSPGILSNDTDGENNPITALLITGPSYASSFNLMANGSFTYNHNGTFNFVDTFTYQVNDGFANGGTNTVTINVIPNTAPSTNDITTSGTEDVVMTLLLKGTDTDLTDTIDHFVLKDIQNLHGQLFSDAALTLPWDNAHPNITAISNQKTVYYVPDPNQNGLVNFQYAAHDSFQEDASPANVDITLKSVNDFPINSIPATTRLLNEDGPVFFFSSPGNTVQISDPDVSVPTTEIFKVKLLVSHGTLSLGSVNGLTFTLGTGMNNSVLEFTGKMNDINTSLSTLSYKSAINYSGADVLTITTNDLGNSGLGAALIKTDGININIIADTRILFSIGDDVFDFNVPGLSYLDYKGESQYDALGGNDFIILPSNSSVLTAVDFDITRTFSGGAGDDQIYGDILNDLINGDLGNDFLVGGLGTNVLNGGLGNDTVSYVTFGPDLGIDGVLVDINAATPFAKDITENGSLLSDTLISIENIIGSPFNDTITGNANNNIIQGGTSKTIGFTLGKNILNGGAGEDTASYVDFKPSPQAQYLTTGVVADLSTGKTEGYQIVDTLTNFENLLGSSYDDKLTGNSLANKLTGGAGKDTIDGKGGNDTLTGGLDKDILKGGTGDDVFIFNSLLELGDTISDFQGAVGLTLHDSLQFSSLFSGDNINHDHKLDSGGLFSGAGAVNSPNPNAYFIYNTTAFLGLNTLYYDADANGGAFQSVAILQFTAGTTLSPLDITFT